MTVYYVEMADVSSIDCDSFVVGIYSTFEKALAKIKEFHEIDDLDMDYEIWKTEIDNPDNTVWVGEG